MSIVKCTCGWKGKLSETVSKLHEGRKYKTCSCPECGAEISDTFSFVVNDPEYDKLKDK